MKLLYFAILSLLAPHLASANGPEIVLDETCFPQAGQVSFSVNLPNNLGPKDWVGVYAVGRSMRSSSLWWTYINKGDAKPTVKHSAGSTAHFSPSLTDFKVSLIDPEVLGPLVKMDFPELENNIRTKEASTPAQQAKIKAWANTSRPTELYVQSRELEVRYYTVKGDDEYVLLSHSDPFLVRSSCDEDEDEGEEDTADEE